MVLGFEPTTFERGSSPITTRLGLPPNTTACLVVEMIFGPCICEGTEASVIGTYGGA